MVLCLLFLFSVLILPGTLAAQTAPSAAVIVVEIQCHPGMANLSSGTDSARISGIGLPQFPELTRFLQLQLE
jgi:hypothetical protein